MSNHLPASWQPVLCEEVTKPYYRTLQDFVARERQAHTIFPPAEHMFAALEHTRFDQVKVLLLGQDPYHGDGQAHGLCFSVQHGVKPPPSLVNIYKELKADLGCDIPNHGCLMKWAEQGVLMLNAVLTVRAHEPNSHKDRGWELFTDAVIRAVNAKPERMVFVLWGAYAQKKVALIDQTRHVIIGGAHPSPLSARRGFMGSKPFSAINAALQASGKSAIDWCIPRR
jgi:uracil-DNA glycosylase